jgi:transposase
MRRQRLFDHEWRKIQVFLPDESNQGRPRGDLKRVVEGILWIIRTGVPDKYGPWQTVYRWFRRWVDSGLWRLMFRTLQRSRERSNKLDWEFHHLDGTIVQAHRHTAGGGQGRQAEGLGFSRGEYSTKVHIRVDNAGHLMGLTITQGQRHETQAFKALMNQGAVRRKWGRPKLRPNTIVGDKGYTAGWIRNWLRQKGINYVIPKKSFECQKEIFRSKLYRQRNVVERVIGHFKEYRRLANRYEKLLDNYKAMSMIAEVFQSLDELQPDGEFYNSA